MSVSLTELRTRAQRLSDMENSSFISDDEWNVYINYGVNELRNFVMNIYPELFVSGTDHTFNTVAGTHTYSLASDHYRIYAADIVNGTYTYTMDRCTPRERNKWANNPLYASRNHYQDVFRYYEPTLDKIRLVPTPRAVYTVNIAYIPYYLELSVDNANTESALEDNWLSYAVNEAVIQAKMKNEDPIQEFLMQRQYIKDNITQNVKERYLSNVHYAADVINGDDWGYY